jgi:hypothetical protein
VPGFPLSSSSSGFSLYREERYIERRDRKEGLVVVLASSKLPPIAFVADTRGMMMKVSNGGA